MFARESDMTASAKAWLQSEGLNVKAEFITPWGYCDLVGLMFNSDRVAQRILLKQSKPITSVARAMVLSRIPDSETGRSISLQELVALPEMSGFQERIKTEVERLICDRFVVRDEECKLQRENGWAPIHERLIAVELKLSRIEEALNQALSHVAFASESYAAFPEVLAERIAINQSRWSSYFDKGVGLLAVTPNRCRILIQSQPDPNRVNLSVQMYCVEKFWNDRPKSSVRTRACLRQTQV